MSKEITSFELYLRPAIYIGIALGLTFISVLFFPNFRGVVLTLIATISGIMAFLSLNAPIKLFLLFSGVLHLLFIMIVFAFRLQFSLELCSLIGAIFTLIVILFGWILANTTLKIS